MGWVQVMHGMRMRMSDGAPSWRFLWRAADWPSRLLFVAVLTLFVGRATYVVKQGRADRLGFMDMGGAALVGDFDRELLRNTYPPSFSVAMAPLAALQRSLGEPASRWLWGAAQLAALGYLTLEFGRALGLQLTLGAIAFAWLSAWRPIVGDLNNQNVTLFLLALVAGALALLRRKRPAAAGVALGVGASLKLWPGLALLGFLRPPRTALPLLLGMVFALGMASLAVVGTLGPGTARAALRFWLTEVVPRAGGTELANQSWRAEILRLTGATAPDGRTGTYQWQLSRLGSLGLAIGGVQWLGFALFTIIRPARSFQVRSLDSVLSLVLGTAALPVAWNHSYVVLIPIALAIVASLPLLESKGRGVLLLFAAGVSLVSLMDSDIVGRAFADRLAFHGNGLLGALLWFAAGLGLRALWQAAPQSPTSTDNGSRSPPANALS